MSYPNIFLILLYKSHLSTESVSLFREPGWPPVEHGTPHTRMCKTFSSVFKSILFLFSVFDTKETKEIQVIFLVNLPHS